VIIMGLLWYFKWKQKKAKRGAREELGQKQAELDEANKTIDTLQIDNELGNVTERLEQAKREQHELMQQRAKLQQLPPSWDMSQSEVLVEVTPADSQYWDVHESFQKTMDDEAWLSKVWRVQNSPLFNFYSFHKTRLIQHGASAQERSCWHGTSGLDPAMIYNDQQDGFMMQFAAAGFWGRGIYFADRAA
jgi:hypothetical protein